MSLPSSRYVRNEASDHAGRVVLSEDTGGETSISLVGIGAGREGGGIVFDVGGVTLAECEADRLGFPGPVVDGLSSGVGVDTGELVSWLEVSPVRPGGCCESDSSSLSCG